MDPEGVGQGPGALRILPFGVQRGVPESTFFVYSRCGLVAAHYDIRDLLVLVGHRGGKPQPDDFRVRRGIQVHGVGNLGTTLLQSCGVDIRGDDGRKKENQKDGKSMVRENERKSVTSI